MANETDLEELKRDTDLVKRGFARMQQDGVNVEQARIATNTGSGMEGDANADPPEEEMLQGRGV